MGSFCVLAESIHSAQETVREERLRTTTSHFDSATHFFISKRRAHAAQKAKLWRREGRPAQCSEPIAPGTPYLRVFKNSTANLPFAYMRLAPFAAVLDGMQTSTNEVAPGVKHRNSATVYSAVSGHEKKRALISLHTQRIRVCAFLTREASHACILLPRVLNYQPRHLMVNAAAARCARSSTVAIKQEKKSGLKAGGKRTEKINCLGLFHMDILSSLKSLDTLSSLKSLLYTNKDKFVAAVPGIGSEHLLPLLRFAISCGSQEAVEAIGKRFERFHEVLNDHALLQAAIDDDRVRMARYLIELGANPALLYPLHTSQSVRMLEVFKDVETSVDMEGCMPLHVAVRRDEWMEDCVYALLERRDTDVDAQNSDGDTVLHVLADLPRRPYPDAFAARVALQVLLRGADPLIQNAEGQTPREVLADTAAPLMRELLDLAPYVCRLRDLQNRISASKISASSSA